MTPIKPPVCTTSPPPPLSLNSTSAKPSSHATLVCGGTSSSANSSPSAVRISARARPLFAFKALTVLRQDVISGILSNVESISCMSSGCGAAIQSYIVVLVIKSRFISDGGGGVWPLRRSGVP